MCSQSPASNGWPKVTGRLACAWELVEATSTQVIAPSAQLDGALGIGTGAEGNVGCVIEDEGKPPDDGVSTPGGGAIADGLVSSSPPLLPPPQPDKAAINSMAGSHLFWVFLGEYFRIAVVFMEIFGTQLTLQA